MTLNMNNFEDSKQIFDIESMPQVYKVKEQVHFEFDFNNLFHLTYSFDALKKVIDRILSELDNQNIKFSNTIDKIIS